jgi:hypothetical protein
VEVPMRRHSVAVWLEVDGDDGEDIQAKAVTY